MSAYLRVVVLCLLISFTFSEEEYEEEPEFEISATSEYNELIGTFDDDLRNDLGNLAIGTKSFQEQIGKERDKMVTEGGYLENDKIIAEVNSQFSVRLRDMVHALHGVVTEVVKTLNSGKEASEEYHECCYFPKRFKRVYDRRFKDNVTFDTFCQRRVPSLDLMKTQPDLKTLKTAFDENLKKTTLNVKWQYFGSTEGLFTAYPASKISNCDNYDNRLRPWYNAAATPAPKNIIILLDSSTSMTRYLKRAKEMAKVVLGTLNPNDKVSLILFNSSLYLPGDSATEQCYKSSMASVTRLSIKRFKALVDTAQAVGSTRYIKAFKKAFSILHHTLSNSPEDVISRPAIILLISDEGQRDRFLQSVVIDGVKKEFEEFRKKFTKSDLNLVVLSFGRNMAFFDELVDATGGKSASIAGEGDYYSRLQPYFDQLLEVIPPVQRKVVLSQPYVDHFGLGYMITATCAVIDGEKKFRGIVGMDVLMPDLVSNVQYFGNGSVQSYAFMFQTQNGVALSHPYIQTPETVSEDQNAIHILEVEDSKEFKELYDEVVQTALAKREGSSFKIITGVQRSRAAGGVMGDGIVTEDVDYQYTCQPLDTENRECITCIVIKLRESNDRYGSSRIFDSAGNHPTAYHRMDVLPEAKTCYHMDTVSYPDRSAVKFSAKAFVNPAEYFEEDERLEAVRLYSKQLFEETQSGGNHEGQKRPIHRNMPMVAILTSYFDRMVWGAGSQKFKGYTIRFVRRYVGTYSGVLRVFPPAPLPTTFDHVTRPWFISAVANDGDATLTHPYLDPLGAGFVVSVSHTVTRDLLDPSLSNDHKIFAVVGGDITISSLGASLLKEMGKGCVYKKELRCFLMDTRGYIIYHPDFEEAYNDSSLVVDRHITTVDGEIARDLIKNGVMKRQECRNLQIRKLQRFYVVDIKGEIYRGDHGACDVFTVARIPKTNVFVVKVKSKLCLVNREMCPCEGVCINEDCECPCNAPMNYDICKAELLSGHDIPLCAQPSPPVAPRPPLPVHPDDLSQCIKTQCSHHRTELDCNEQYGCAWCTTNFTTNLVLKKHRCRRDRECFGGALGRKNPFLLPFRPKKAEDKAAIINVLGMKFTQSSLRTTGICVGVGILFIVALVWWCKRKDKWEIEFDEMLGGQDFMDARMSTMQMAQRQSAMQMAQRQSAMQMAQRQSAMQMAQRQSAMHMSQMQSAMQMGQRQSAMHMGQRQSAMHMAQRQSTLQMGQRPSNMQMMMNNPGMQYSSQAMSGMWSTQGYGGQSQMVGSMSMGGNTQFFNFDTY